MTVDIGDGRSGVVNIRSGDDPALLAQHFVTEHELDEDVLPALTDHIANNALLAQDRLAAGADVQNVGTGAVAGGASDDEACDDIQQLQASPLRPSAAAEIASIDHVASGAGYEPPSGSRIPEAAGRQASPQPVLTAPSSPSNVRSSPAVALDFGDAGHANLRSSAAGRYGGGHSPLQPVPAVEEAWDGHAGLAFPPSSSRPRHEPSPPHEPLPKDRTDSTQRLAGRDAAEHSGHGYLSDGVDRSDADAPHDFAAAYGRHSDAMSSSRASRVLASDEDAAEEAYEALHQRFRSGPVASGRRPSASSQGHSARQSRDGAGGSARPALVSGKPLAAAASGAGIASKGLDSGRAAPDQAASSSAAVAARRAAAAAATARLTVPTAASSGKGVAAKPPVPAKPPSAVPVNPALYSRLHSEAERREQRLREAAKRAEESERRQLVAEHRQIVAASRGSQAHQSARAEAPSGDDGSLSPTARAGARLYNQGKVAAERRRGRAEEIRAALHDAEPWTCAVCGSVNVGTAEACVNVLKYGRGTAKDKHSHAGAGASAGAGGGEGVVHLCGAPRPQAGKPVISTAAQRLVRPTDFDAYLQLQIERYL